MLNVIVTDGDERAALAATRSLGRSGTVHVVAERRNSLAGMSRRATSRHAAPSPLADPGAFAAAVSNLAASTGADVVLPISDAACRALLSVRDHLAAAVLAAPPAEAYSRISDKAVVAELAREQGIEIPPGAVATSEDDAVRIAVELGWPVVLKPVESVASERDGGVRKVGVERVDDAEAMRKAWSCSVGTSKALVQRIVPGWGEGVFVLRSGGETIAAFAHRRLREKPPGGGVSVLRESIALDRDLLRRVESVLDSVGFEGVAMAEFKCDERTTWLMEFNARLWGSLQLALDAGIDFPRLLIESALGRRPEPVEQYQAGVRSRWLLGDVDHAIALARGGCDAKGRSGLVAGLGVLLRSTGPRSRFEVFRLTDPAPFLHELRDWLRALAR
jgi:predicted ATP-grasp superfamily ATP-dependent carboligase